MPVRIARPERISGMADQLRNPSYGTSVGLLRLGLIMEREDERRGRAARNGGFRVRGEGANGGSGKRRTPNWGRVDAGGVMGRLTA